MKEELIGLLEQLGYKKTTNGKQQRYTKQYQMNVYLWCELLIIANKEPMLFYKVVRGKRRTVEEETIHSGNAKTTIEEAIETIKGFESLKRFYLKFDGLGNKG